MLQDYSSSPSIVHAGCGWSESLTTSRGPQVPQPCFMVKPVNVIMPVIPKPVEQGYVTCKWFHSIDCSPDAHIFKQYTHTHRSFLFTFSSSRFTNPNSQNSQDIKMQLSDYFSSYWVEATRYVLQMHMWNSYHQRLTRWCSRNTSSVHLWFHSICKYECYSFHKLTDLTCLRNVCLFFSLLIFRFQNEQMAIICKTGKNTWDRYGDWELHKFWLFSMKSCCPLSV